MADPTDDPEAEPPANADPGPAQNGPPLAEAEGYEDAGPTADFEAEAPCADDVPPLSEAAQAALAGALPSWDLMPGDAVAR